jgi:hypothetical protein
MSIVSISSIVGFESSFIFIKKKLDIIILIAYIFFLKAIVCFGLISGFSPLHGER